MEITEIRGHLDRTIEFPVGRTELIAALGDREVRAPGGGTTRLAEAIDRTDERTYGSATEAHETIVGNLGENFVGRKYYDDRGGATEDRHATQSL